MKRTKRIEIGERSLDISYYCPDSVSGPYVHNDDKKTLIAFGDMSSVEIDINSGESVIDNRGIVDIVSVTAVWFIKVD